MWCTSRSGPVRPHASHMQVWSLSALSSEGFRGLDTLGLAPILQETHSGYLQIHLNGSLTVAWQNSTEGDRNMWQYWHILPEDQIAILTRSKQIPTNYDTNALTKRHISSDAWEALQRATRWLHRVHAHTPIVKWYDVYASEQVKQTYSTTSSHVMGIVYSTTRDGVPDIELRLHCMHTKHEYISVRVSRERRQVTLQQYADTAQMKHEATTLKTMSLEAAQEIHHQAKDSSLQHWAIRKALAMQASADLMRAYIQPSVTPVSPKPLTHQRRQDLQVKERAWYERRNAAWPFDNASRRCRRRQQ